MKVKKFLVLAVLGLVFLSGISYAAQPEDALSTRPDDSLYFVLRLGDTAKFLQWLVSNENVQLFMPLILGSKESNEIIGTIEILNTVVQNTPLKSAALVVGINKSDVKARAPFFQMAFTVNPVVSSVVRSIASGTAEAKDIAKLILGDSNAALLSIAETVIKVERGEDGTFKINNEVFMKAADDLVILGTSLEDVISSVNALEDSGARLFASKTKRFDAEDFAFLHIDYETAAELESDDADLAETKHYFDKPLEIEFAFKRFVGKFAVSAGMNIKEAMSPKYINRIWNGYEPEAVKGGNINPKNIGKSKTPLIAIGTLLNMQRLKESTSFRQTWNKAVREAQKRFGLTEEDLTGALTGPFSAAVNDSVTFEGFKIPALYLSHTGKEGAAETLYDKLTKSQHFMKVQEGVLQLDSSISPISCLVVKDGDTLGIDFAELSNLGGTPELKPAFAELMNHESVAAFWLDFAGIRDWLLDDSNGVFTSLAPLAAIMGYGKYVQAFRDVLGAEFSVPSLSVWSESNEVFHAEFAVAEIDPQKGFLSKVIKLYSDFMK